MKRQRHQRKQQQSLADVDDLMEGSLERRARRMRRRGEHRRAMITLREAVCRQNEDARLWTLYGAQCMRVGKTQDAERAFTQALWLRQQGRDQARARVTRRILERLRRGERELRLSLLPAA